MTGQAQQVSLVLSLCPVTSAAAIVIKMTTHSTLLALGVAAIVATAMVLATISLARTEKCKELAKAYERRRLVKRATSGWHLSIFNSKNANALRDAAKDYRPDRNEHPEKAEHLEKVDAKTAEIASSRERKEDATKGQRSVNRRAAKRKEVREFEVNRRGASVQSSPERHVTPGRTGHGPQPVRSPQRKAGTLPEIAPTKTGRTGATSVDLKPSASPSPAPSPHDPPAGSRSADSAPSAAALWLGLFSSEASVSEWSVPNARR